MKDVFRGLTVGDALVVAMGVLAGSSLSAALRGPGLWWAIGLGAAVSVLVAVIAKRLELLAIEWVAVSIAALVIFGGLAVSVVPTPDGYTTFIRGLISGWADLLTSVPPVTANDTLRVLPYVLTLVATTTGLIIRRKSSIPVLPAAGPLVVFGIGLLFSIETITATRIQGALLVATAIALGWWQQRASGVLADADIGNTTVVKRRGRVLYGATLLAAVSVIAPLIAPVLASAHGTERVDLYNALTPPFNPLDEPSPLAQIKANYQDDVREDVVFVARGDQVPRRWALATLGSYNGVVWTVGDASIQGEADFRPVDGGTAVDPLDPEPNAELESVSVEVELVGEEIDWPWLPLPGRAQQIDAFDDAGERLDVRFFDRTGTAAIPSGANGLSYSVTATPFPQVPDQADLTLASQDSNLELEQQAEAVVTASATLVEGADSGWAQVVALAENLRAASYLATDIASPGHSQGRLAEFLETDVFVGNEEQYAAFGAIAARNSTRSPARVVVGWVADDDKTLSGEVPFTRDEATAWIEVFTDEFGWVPVDVTPDRSNEPELDTAGTNFVDVAAPNPPVPPPPPPELEANQDELEDDEDDEDDDEDESAGGVPTWAIAGGTALAVPIVAIGLWLLLMLALKRVRRQRRRSRGEANHKVAGAWFETKDRLHEAGIRPRPDMSVNEVAQVIDLRFDSATNMTGLAAIVDEIAFGPADARNDLAESAWERSDEISALLASSAPRTERLRRIARPGSLFQRDPSSSDATLEGR